MQVTAYPLAQLALRPPVFTSRTLPRHVRRGMRMPLPVLPARATSGRSRPVTLLKDPALVRQIGTRSNSCHGLRSFSSPATAASPQRPPSWPTTTASPRSTCPNTPTSRSSGRPPTPPPATSHCPTTATCARWIPGSAWARRRPSLAVVVDGGGATGRARPHHTGEIDRDARSPVRRPGQSRRRIRLEHRRTRRPQRAARGGAPCCASTWRRCARCGRRRRRHTTANSVNFGPSWAWPKPIQSHIPILVGAAGTEKNSRGSPEVPTADHHAARLRHRRAGQAAAGHPGGRRSRRGATDRRAGLQAGPRKAGAVGRPRRDGGAVRPARQGRGGDCRLRRAAGGQAGRFGVAPKRAQRGFRARWTTR